MQAEVSKSGKEKRVAVDRGQGGSNMACRSGNVAWVPFSAWHALQDIEAVVGGNLRAGAANYV
jgi:hypothetical protein